MTEKNTFESTQWDETIFVSGFKVFAICEREIRRLEVVNGELKAFDENDLEMVIHRIH